MLIDNLVILYWKNYKGVVPMHAQTHKLISQNLYEFVSENYDIELNKKMLDWGSVAPDILPKYKLYRHYYDNSIDYIIYKIAKIIFLNRFLDFTNGSYINLKVFSRDLGIISHYLSDFTCRAHADRWEFPKSLVKHVKYEIDLNDNSKSHEFSHIDIEFEPFESGAASSLEELVIIKKNIEKVVNSYLEEEPNFQTDLDYALALNKAVYQFIIESILAYNYKESTDLAFGY